ncbi:MAG: ATP-binding cassette domain-containing protein, partial [Clostridia bacterium]
KDSSLIANDSFKKAVGILSGETYLFEDSIFNNIKMAKPDATLEEVMAAAKMSGLEGKINKFPKGINTMLKKNGDILSETEKQFLEYARIILQNPKILIIDEAITISDKRVKKTFFNSLNKFVENKTCIYISTKEIEEFVHSSCLYISDGKIV